jgi:hypothetical protein
MKIGRQAFGPAVLIQKQVLDPRLRGDDRRRGQRL